MIPELERVLAFFRPSRKTDRLTPSPPQSRLDARKLLRLHRQRPRERRAAEHRDEIAPFHCPVSPVPPNEKNSIQGIAALRDFEPVYVAYGSFATGTRPATAPAMSAVPPKAEVNPDIGICRDGVLAGWRCHPARDSSSQTGASNHALRTRRYEWAVIKPFLPNKPRGVPRVNDRRVLNGIFWVLRAGAPWRAGWAELLDSPHPAPYFFPPCLPPASSSPAFLHLPSDRRSGRTGCTRSSTMAIG